MDYTNSRQKDEIALAYLDGNKSTIIKELKFGKGCIGSTLFNEAAILNRSSFQLQKSDIQLINRSKGIFLLHYKTPLLILIQAV